MASISVSQGSVSPLNTPLQSSSKSPGSQNISEERIKRLFLALDTQQNGSLDCDALMESFRRKYHPLPYAEKVADEILQSIKQVDSSKGISYEEFKSYIERTETRLASAFAKLDRNKDGKLDLEEMKRGLQDVLDEDSHLDDPSDELVELFFDTIDLDDDGYITFDEWRNFLLFVPNETGSALRAAYRFFIEEMDLSSEGDMFISSETVNGMGYFLAGGFAGVVSRTCTAPFDRVKVFLIAQSGMPFVKEPVKGSSQATEAAAKEAAKTTSKAIKTAAKESAKTASVEGRPGIAQAVRHLYKVGGFRAFFVGNGLNVIKVFPESAMKFGSFEAAKRFLSGIEGSDPSEVSRGATFLAGGIGGVVAQLTVYPIDTLKFRLQCEAQFSKYKGNQLLFMTAKQMWLNGGFRTFYRGLNVGLLGIFPFAALDLGTFAAMKRYFISREALKLDIEESEVRLGNMAVLTMGALSGSVGASAVYPINLLRTRLQAQGTHAHPYTYTGFMDVYHKTVARDGYRGLFRGLVPNLAKVAPAVSISYLVYENLKTFMTLD